MRAHDALRKAFVKFNIYADPYTLLELETFVISASKRYNGNKNPSYLNLISNIEAVLIRQETENANELSKKLADYILDLCKDGCD